MKTLMLRHLLALVFFSPPVPVCVMIIPFDCRKCCIVNLTKNCLITCCHCAIGHLVSDLGKLVPFPDLSEPSDTDQSIGMYINRNISFEFTVTCGSLTEV